MFETYKKMNPKILKQWIKELSSGEWVQGRKALCKVTLFGDKMCCLGVLGDIAVRQHIVEGWVRPRNAYFDDDLKPGNLVLKPGNKEWSGALPPIVLKWAGLSTRAEKELIKLNDSQEKSFKEIADWIEKNL